MKGRKARMVGADGAIVYFPIGLREDLVQENMPALNVWDPLLSEKVFRFMNKYLGDTGLFALLHNREYEHLLIIVDACTKTWFFWIASSSIVLMTVPQWKPKREFQVNSLRLNIFSRIGSKVKIPKEKNFSPLDSSQNGSLSNLLSMHLRNDDGRHLFGSFGSLQLSVGFMQTPIELMMVLGDIFWDCIVVSGQSFTASDYAGRFVLCLEDRLELADFVAAKLQTILHPPLLSLPRTSNKLKNVVDEKAKKGEAPDPWALLDSDGHDSASGKGGEKVDTLSVSEDESSDV